MTELTPEDQDLFDNLEGLFAYDTGCVSSGIHDDLLKEESFERLLSMNMEARRYFLSRVLRDAYLSEDGLAAGYGIEDVVSFVQWLDRHGVHI